MQLSYDQNKGVFSFSFALKRKGKGNALLTFERKGNALCTLFKSFQTLSVQQHWSYSLLLDLIMNSLTQTMYNVTIWSVWFSILFSGETNEVCAENVFSFFFGKQLSLLIFTYNSPVLTIRKTLIIITITTQCLR